MAERVGVLSSLFRPGETENDNPVPGQLLGWSATVGVQELLHQNVIEQAHGKVSLNHLFKVPKWDS